jgi:hypothetical protein
MRQRGRRSTERTGGVADRRAFARSLSTIAGVGADDAHIFAEHRVHVEQLVCDVTTTSNGDAMRKPIGPSHATAMT